MEKNGCKLGIMGLNTAFRQLHIGFRGKKLTLWSQQLRQVCDNNDSSEWAKKHHICLLMTHHPLESLDESSQKDLLNEISNAEYIVVHLCGHDHKTELIEKQIHREIKINISKTCSFFGIDRKGHVAKHYDHPIKGGYVIGRIKLTEGFPSGELTFWPRCFLKEKFISDTPGALEDLPNSHTRSKKVTLSKPPKIIPRGSLPENNSGKSQDMPSFDKESAGKDASLTGMKKGMEQNNNSEVTLNKKISSSLPQLRSSKEEN